MGRSQMIDNDERQYLLNITNRHKNQKLWTIHNHFLTTYYDLELPQHFPSISTTWRTLCRADWITLVLFMFCTLFDKVIWVNGLLDFCLHEMFLWYSILFICWFWTTTVIIISLISLNWKISEFRVVSILFHLLRIYIYFSQYTVAS
jgi:hypothetical protein